MKHGADDGTRRRVWRVAVTTLISLGLVASATSSLATGVDEGAAWTQSTTLAEPAQVLEPAVEGDLVLDGDAAPAADGDAAPAAQDDAAPGSQDDAAPAFQDEVPAPAAPAPSAPAPSAPAPIEAAPPAAPLTAAPALDRARRLGTAPSRPSTRTAPCARHL